jgi:hypothetical protein
LKLREEAPPRRDRLFRRELVWSVLREPSARFLFAQPVLLIGPEPGDQFAGVQAVRHTRLWRFARDGRHVVCSLRGGTTCVAMLPQAMHSQGDALGKMPSEVREPFRKSRIRGVLGRLGRWTLVAIVLGLALIGFLHLTRGTAVRHVRGVSSDGTPIAVGEPEFPLMAAMATGAWLFPGNRVEVLLNGDGTYPRQWDDLRSAKQSNHASAVLRRQVGWRTRLDRS